MKPLRVLLIALALTSGLAASPAAAQPSCFGRTPTIVGTKGNDVIVGAPGADVITALDGRDTVNGRGGNDRICGGNLGDELVGGPGNDRILAGMGLDTVRGSGGHDHIVIGANSDIDLDHYEYAYGGAGDDELISDYTPGWLVGGDGDDTLRTGKDSSSPGAGMNGYSDYLDGGDGADELLVEVSGECETSGILFGGAGDDLFSDPYGCSYISFEKAAQAIFVDLAEGVATGEGNDTLEVIGEGVVGSDFADQILGSAEDNYLYGGPGDDEIDGREGSDYIDGEDGIDTCRNGETTQNCENP